MRAADLSAVMQAHRARIEGIELAHSDRMEHLEARHKVELEQAAARHAAASAAQASLGWSFTGLTSEYDLDMASDDRFYWSCTQGLVLAGRKRHGPPSQNLSTATSNTSASWSMNHCDCSSQLALG